MHKYHPYIFVLPLLGAALFWSGCSTVTKIEQVEPSVAVAKVSPTLWEPIIVEGVNYRYVKRQLGLVDTSETQAPYWLTDLDNTERERVRVLPDNNYGVALVLQAAVAVPKLLIQSVTAKEDLVHVRIVNRSEQETRIQVSCTTRDEPSEQRALIPNLDMGPRSMIDLALNTHSRDRGNLLLRVR
jgi:hypothetical protein